MSHGLPPVRLRGHRARWRRLGLCVLSLALAGCAGPFGLTGMSSSQLKELARVKDAGVTCVWAVYAGVMIKMISINVDKGIPAGVKIGDQCEASFIAESVEKRSP